MNVAATSGDESQAVPCRVQSLGEGTSDWECRVSAGGILPVVCGLTVRAADAPADDDDGDTSCRGLERIHGRQLQTDMAYK